jgi:peptidoglycan/LPS O-acetylase OafA/YrhL
MASKDSCSTVSAVPACERRSGISKFHTLQILRGLAASLVVFDHAYLRQVDWGTEPGPFVQLAEFAGAQAVAIFFVISGYIMIAKGDRQFGLSGAATDFLWKRIVRIVPLYWTATLLELVLRLHKGASIDPWAIPASLLFIPRMAMSGDYMRPLLGVGWTLNYEMLFYAVFATALLFGRRLGLPFLFSTLVTLVVLGLIEKPLTDSAPPHTLFAYWTDPVILLFAAGVALGLLAQPRPWHERIRHPIMITLALLILCLWAFAAGKVAFPLHWGWQLAAWSVCVTTVAVCIFGRQSVDNGFAGAASRLGDMSYSLYLFHFFVVVAVEKIWWQLFGKEYAFLFILAAYAASVGAAYAVYQLVEQNFGRLFARHGRNASRVAGALRAD